MREFKKGDKIRAIENYYKIRKGDVFYVDSLSSGGLFLRVKGDDYVYAYSLFELVPLEQLNVNEILNTEMYKEIK